jgi:hypothetical protein
VEGKEGEAQIIDDFPIIPQRFKERMWLCTAIMSTVLGSSFQSKKIKKRNVVVRYGNEWLFLFLLFSFPLSLRSDDERWEVSAV